MNQCKVAPLDKQPDLPVAQPTLVSPSLPQYAYCFTPEEAEKLEKRMIILKRDDTYCRDAYKGIK